MRTIILNTSIVTAYGSYRYVPATREAVAELLSLSMDQGVPIVNAVGHQSTAEILTTLFPFYPVTVNRIEYLSEVGDAAIVFKLRGRPPEGTILTREQIDTIGYDFGILYRDK
jgi:hypothetical protein